MCSIESDMCSIESDKEKNSEIEDQEYVNNANYLNMDAHFVLENIIEPLDVLSDQELLDTIRPNDDLIDIVGVLESIPKPVSRTMKNGEKKNICNIILFGENRTKISITVWEEEISNIMPKLIAKSVLYFENLYASPCMKKYNCNRYNYQLTAKNNTSLNILKVMNDEIDENEEEIVYYNIAEALNEKSIGKELCLKDVVIKTVFRMKDKAEKIGIGVIVDSNQYCEYKLNTIIKNFEIDHKYKKNEIIDIKGKIIDGENLYFEAEYKDVKKKEGKIYSGSDCKIYMTPKRIAETPRSKHLVNIGEKLSLSTPKRGAEESAEKETKEIKKKKLSF